MTFYTAEFEGKKYVFETDNKPQIYKHLVESKTTIRAMDTHEVLKAHKDGTEIIDLRVPEENKGKRGRPPGAKTADAQSTVAAAPTSASSAPTDPVAASVAAASNGGKPRKNDGFQ